MSQVNIPDIDWLKFTTDQIRFTLVLLNFLYDGVKEDLTKRKPTRDRVFAALDKLPKIVELAGRCQGWEVFSPEGASTFQQETINRKKSIEIDQRNDDLPSAGSNVTICERMFAGMVGGVEGFDFDTIWVNRKGSENDIARWLKRNISAGRQHLRSAG